MRPFRGRGLSAPIVCEAQAAIRMVLVLVLNSARVWLVFFTARSDVSTLAHSFYAHDSDADGSTRAAGGRDLTSNRFDGHL